MFVIQHDPSFVAAILLFQLVPSPGTLRDPRMRFRCIYQTGLVVIIRAPARS